MLKLLENEKIKDVISFSQKHPLGVHIACKLTAYGTDKDFLYVWYSEDEMGINAAFLSFFGDVIICADDGADFEEIGAFISAYGYKSIFGQKDTLIKCGFTVNEEKTMFEFTGNTAEAFPEVQNGADMKRVYELIAESIPGSFSADKEAYLSFLSDFTYRERRSLARLKTVCENERVYSCALTAAECDTSALISGVASDKNIRGKGYGKKTVLTLANELLKEDKKVYVIALNDSAKEFYKKIGFSECITVGYTER